MIGAARGGRNAALEVLNKLAGRGDTHQGRERLHQSFLAYRGAVHGRRAALLVAVAFAIYLIHDPFDGRNGGTWLGYVLGTLGALLIVWLTLFGLRKRSYRSTLGTVEGWLSAHVYFGSALLIIATLHSGGELGWNIHGAAYVLMCLVIATGFFGVYVYRRYPALISKERAGASRQQLLEEVAELDRRCLAVAQNLGADIQTALRSAIERTVLAGSAWNLLRGRDVSKVALPATAPGGGGLQHNEEQRAIVGFLADLLGKSGGAAQTLWLQELVDLCARRQKLLSAVRTDVRRQMLMSAWLQLHVPLTFALLGALTAHIVSVFVYW